MTDHEIKVLNKIPKKYRTHIESINIYESGDYNDRGQLLFDYIVTWDNGDMHTFQNIAYMTWAIKTNTVDGYYIEP